MLPPLPPIILTSTSGALVFVPNSLVPRFLHACASRERTRASSGDPRAIQHALFSTRM